MGVPVVTLVGKRHGERSAYSILHNLGVTQTVAQAGREYVDIAVRLAEDAAFSREVRDAIAREACARRRWSTCRRTRATSRRRTSRRCAEAPEVLDAAGVADPALLPIRGSTAAERATSPRARASIAAGAARRRLRLPRNERAGRVRMLRSRAHEGLRQIRAARSPTSKARSRSIRAMRAPTTSSASCASTTGSRSARSRRSRARPSSTRVTRAHGTTSAARCATTVGSTRRGRRSRAPSQADPRYALASANLGVALSRPRPTMRMRRVRSLRALAIDPEHRARADGARGPATRGRPPRRGLARCTGVRSPSSRAMRDRASCTRAPLAERDDLDEARACLRRSAARDDPQLLRARLRSPSDAADGRRRTQTRSTAARAAFERGLARVRDGAPCARGGARRHARVVDELRWTNFLLAYQGEDDRPLQARFAATMARAIDARRSGAARADAQAPSTVAPVADRLRLLVLSRRHGRPLLRALDHRPAARVVRGDRLRAAAGGRPVAQRLAARADRFRHCPRFRPSQVAAQIRDDAPDVARLSGARHGRDDVRDRRAAARAAAMRGVGPSGDDRPSDDRRVLHQRTDGARGCRRALHRAAGAPARHRHALRGAGDSGARRPRQLGLPRRSRCSCARNRCSRSLRTTIVCSPACLPPSRTRGCSCSKVAIRR